MHFNQKKSKNLCHKEFLCVCVNCTKAKQTKEIPKSYAEQCLTNVTKF